MWEESGPSIKNVTDSFTSILPIDVVSSPISDKILLIITGAVSSTSVIENVTVVAALWLPAASVAVTVKL